ncbi:MAG: glycosyltransferase family 4 protein [Chloroflexota bacterium]
MAALARHMVAAGHDVDVLTEQRGDKFPALQEAGGVTIRRFCMSSAHRRYGVALSLWRYIARHGHQYDIIHAHSYHAFSSVGATLTLSRPLVFTPHYHGTGSTALGTLLHLPYRSVGAYIFYRANHVICVSRAEMDLVRAHFPFVARRISVIPNGIDVDALRGAKPFPGITRVVLSAGRLKSYKNVHRVIAALLALDSTYGLYVAGSGPALAQLQFDACHLGLTGRVTFLGEVDDPSLRRWYRTAEVYVSLSEQEAFGLTLLEALGAGTPVVASDIPAHREIQQLTGSRRLTLVPLDASDHEVARAIRDASARPRDEDAMGRLPSWTFVARQTLAIYESLTS